MFVRNTSSSIAISLEHYSTGRESEILFVRLSYRVVKCDTVSTCKVLPPPFFFWKKKLTQLTDRDLDLPMLNLSYVMKMPEGVLQHGGG